MYFVVAFIFVNCHFITISVRSVCIHTDSNKHVIPIWIFKWNLVKYSFEPPPLLRGLTFVQGLKGPNILFYYLKKKATLQLAPNVVPASIKKQKWSRKFGKILKWIIIIVTLVIIYNAINAIYIVESLILLKLINWFWKFYNYFHSKIL